MTKTDITNIIKETISRVLTENKTEEQVIEFLKQYPTGNIPDKDVHDFADTLGIETSKVESMFYKLAARYVASLEDKKKEVVKENKIQLTEGVKELVKQYKELEYDTMDFSQLMEIDEPLSYVKDELFKGDDTEWKLFLRKRKLPENETSAALEREFLRTPSIKPKVIKFLDARDADIAKKQKVISKQLEIKYPVLKKLNDELEESPLTGQAIKADGRRAGYYTITTPGYYSVDVKLTPDEAKEYKQFLKDKGITQKRRSSNTSRLPYYD